MFLLAACILSGLGALFGDGEPRALQRALEPWMVTAWSVMLLTGSATALTGVALPSPSWGVLVERVGLHLLASASLAYATVIVIMNGQPAVFAGLMTGAFGAACYARAVQITRAVRRAREVVDDEV